MNEYLSQLDSKLADITGTDTKAVNLEQKRQEKVNRLGENKQFGNLDNSFTTLDDGRIESNRNKIWNELNPLEMQYLTGYATQEFYNPNQDSQETRRLYNYGTKDDNVKLGLSTGGADTSDVRYDSTIDPKYNQWWRRSGETGPDLDQKQYDIPMDFAAATTLEALQHGNKRLQEYRKYPNYLGDEALQQDGGVSEYYLGDQEDIMGDANLYQELTPEREVELQNYFKEQMQLPGANPSSNFSGKGIDNTAALDKLISEEKGYLSNLVDAGQAGFGTAFARVGDSIADALLTEGVAKELKELGVSDDIIKDGDFKGFDKYKLNEEYGYDDSRVQDYVSDFKTTFKDPNSTFTDKALITLKGIAYAPEVLANSSGDIALGMMGVPGLALMASGQTNEILEQRKENNDGKENTPADYAISTASGVLYAAVNMFTKGSAGLAETSRIVKEAAKFMDKTSLTSVIKRLGANGLIEGAEEAFQGVTEVLGSKLGTKKEDEILTQETALDLGAQAALGGGAGIGGTGAREAVSAVLKPSRELLDETIGREPDLSEGVAPTTVAGKRNVFFAEETPTNLESEEAKTAYTSAVSDYTLLLLADDNEIKNSPYMDITPGERVNKILNDAVEKVSTIENATTDGEKQVVKAKLVSNIKAAMDTAVQEAGTPEAKQAKDSIFKQVVESSTNDPYVAREIEKAYQEELEAELVDFIEEAKQKGYDLSNVDLDPEQARNVKRVLNRMKSLGSEEVSNTANDINEILFTKRKGKKTFKQVRDEIEKIGFLLYGKHYKSLNQHKVDLEQDIITNTVDSKNLDNLNDFIKTRGAQKIKLTATNDSTGSRERRSKLELKNFIRIEREDTIKLRNIISGLLSNENMSEEMRAKLEESQAEVNAKIAEMDSLLSLQNENDLVRQVAELSKEPVAVEDLLKMPVRKSSNRPVPITKEVDVTPTQIEGEVEAEVPTEVNANAMFAGLDSTKEYDIKDIRALVQDMLQNPDKYEDTPARTQFIQNNRSVINRIAKELEIMKARESQPETVEEETTTEETTAPITEEEVEAATEEDVEPEAELVIEFTDKEIYEVLKDDGFTFRELFDKLQSATDSELDFDKVVRLFKQALTTKVDNPTLNAFRKYFRELVDGEEYLQNEILALRGIEQINAELQANTLEEVSPVRAKISNIVTSASDKFKANLNKETTLSERVGELGGLSKVVSDKLGSTLLDLMPKVIKERMEKQPKVIDEALKVVEQFGKEKFTYNTKTRKLELVNLPTQKGKDNPLLWLNEVLADPEAQQQFEDTINMVAIIGLDNMVNARSMSSSELEEFVDGAFSSLKVDGVLKNKKQLMDKVRRGEFVPLATYRQELGQRLFKELGLKFSDTITKQEKQDMINALGQLSIERMKKVFKRKGDYSISTKAIEIGLDGSLQDKQQSTDSGRSVNVIVMSGIQDTKGIHSAARVLEYAGPKSDGSIQFEPTVIRKGKKVRNGNTEMSADTIEYINKQNKEPWSFSDSFKSLYKDAAKRAESGKETINEQFYRIVLGNKQDIIKNTDINEVESALAKYEADKLDIDRMLMAYEIAGDSQFFLDWDYTVSGRYMINNRMINPQNSKISRFVINMGDQKATINKVDGKFDDTEIAIIKAGAAQALDLDIDKTSDKVAFDKLAEEYFDIREDGTVDYADTANGRRFERLVKFYREGSYVTALSVLRQMGIDTNEVMHVYQVVDVLAQLENGSDTVTTNLGLEIDAITNGMMLTMMEIGSDWAWSMLEKGGIYRQQKNGTYKYNNHGEFKEAGQADIYEVPVETFTGSLRNNKAVGEPLLDLVENKMNNNWRKLMKPLVMVFIYGAGMSTIKQNAGETFGMLLAKDLIKDNKEVELQALMKRAFQSLNAGREEAGLPTLKTSEIRRATLDENNLVTFENGTDLYIDEFQQYVLGAYVNEQIGEFIENAFVQDFEEVIKFREAIKSVETLNYAIFKSELDKKLDAYTDDKGIVQISDSEFSAILEQLQSEGTYYGAKDSAGAWQDYFKETNSEDTKNTVKVTGFMNEANNSARSAVEKEVNSPVKIPTSNVGAVGVTTIHNKDGRTMYVGNKKAVLNIYDALVLGVDKDVASSEAKSMNKAMLTVSAKHSILTEAYNRLEKNLDKLDLENIDATQLADIKRVFVVPAEELISNKTDSIVDTIKSIMNNRKNMEGTTVKAGHYYVADVLGVSEETIGKVSRSELKNIDKVTDKLNEFFGKINDVEAGSKGIDGTIKDTKISASDAEALIKGC